MKPHKLNRRQIAEKTGRFAESFAALWLSMKGYHILAQRFRSPVGEIDLIARRGTCLAFVEVKKRTKLEQALAAVTPQSRVRITRAAQIWVAANPGFAQFDLRFDVIALTPRGLPLHLKNAFSADPF